MKGPMPIADVGASPRSGRARAVEINGLGLRGMEREQPAALQSDYPGGKVVPFARGRRDSRPETAASEIIVAGSDRPLPALTGGSRFRWTAALLCSMAAHAALYLPFQREPPPMASIGLETLSVEIVLGANEDAGIARERGVAEQTAPTPAQTPEPTVERRPEIEIAEVAPQNIEPQRFETAAVEVQSSQAALAIEAQAVAEQPRTEAVIAAPAPPQAVPETPQEIARPQPPREPEPQTSAPPRRPAAKPESRPKTRHASVAGAPNESRSSAPAASASGGVGRGRSDHDTNYRGLVSAHLARHKRFPPEARGRGDQGSAVVTFALSGSGGVTSVRLARPSGFASLDIEATAMVRRASPFPPPPDGRPVSFTVPVSFRLN